MSDARVRGRRNAFAVAVGLAGSFAFSGCGPAPPKRGRMFGKVDLDGTPLAQGQIRLFALSAEGTGTDAQIVDGQYDIPASRGPTAATYRIEIVSLKATGRRVPDPDTGGLVDEMANLVPPRYNTESTLQITYEPGAGKPYDFNLKTK